MDPTHLWAPISSTGSPRWFHLRVLMLALLATAAPACNGDTGAGGKTVPASKSASKTPAGGPEITKGPLLLHVGTDQAALVWECNTKGKGQVDYRVQGGDTTKATGQSKVTEVTYNPGWLDQQERLTVYVHKAILRQLKPGTTYQYRVSAAGVQGDQYAFTTAETNPKKIVFAAYGDSRHGVETHRALVEMMIRHEVQFVINTGDLVNMGGFYDEWGPQFFDPLKGLGERVPIYTTMGNHDGDGRYYRLLCLPEGGKSNYSFTRGKALFVGLDNYERQIDSFAWGKDQLARAKAEWKFVFYHVPSLSLGWPKGRAWQYPDALRAWDRAGVDAVFQGDAHMYERFRPLLSKPDAKRGTTYITTGGGGAVLYWPVDHLLLATSARLHHFCLFTIQDDTLSVKVFDVEGQVIDEFEITKRDGEMDAAYLKSGVHLARAHLEQAMREDFNIRLVDRVLARGRPVRLQITIGESFATDGPVKLTFTLDTPGESFTLGGTKSLTVTPGQETVHTLTLTPLEDIDLRYPTFHRLNTGLQVKCEGDGWEFTMPCQRQEFQIDPQQLMNESGH